VQKRAERPLPEVSKPLFLAGVEAHRRSPPVLNSGSGYTLSGMRENCTRINNGGEDNTDVRVDSSLGYSPCGRHISHIPVTYESHIVLHAGHKAGGENNHYLAQLTLSKAHTWAVTLSLSDRYICSHRREQRLLRFSSHQR